MKFWIIDENMVQSDGVEISSTSENSDYPDSNIATEHLSQAWRSATAGRFIIDASNCNIDFNEGAAEINATLTQGTYTATTLASHIASVMTAASLTGATYTVSQGASTGLWTISTDGASLSLLWSTGANSATSVGSDIGFAVSADYTGSTSYTGSVAAIHSSHGEAISFNFSAPIDVDAIALLFDKTTGCRLSAGATVKVQANSFPDWTNPPVDETLSIDTRTETYTKFWSEKVTYQYWRVLIIDPSNHWLYVTIGAVVIGKSLELVRIPANGFQFERRDPSNVERTPYGHEYSDIYPTAIALRVNMNAASYHDIRLLDQAFIRCGQTRPMFVVTDPFEDEIDREQFMLYCKFDDDLELSHRIKTYFDAELRFREVN